MPTIREQLLATIYPKVSPRLEGNNAKEEFHNRFLIRDDEIQTIVSILSGNPFSDLFYNVETDKWLRWDLELNSLVDFAGELYLAIDFQENFEGGVLPAGWTVVNGGENDWNVGTAAASEGTNGLYISNDAGVSNVYSSIGAGLDVSHVYVDIALPVASNQLILEFDWRCEAEVGFDWGSVYKTLPAFTPTANVENPAIDQIGQSEYNNQSVFDTERINLPLVDGGTTKRFIWSWRNDTTVENQPPMAIDNVKILFG